MINAVTYFLLELLKLSVIVACKALPLDAKDYFIIAEVSKLIIIGLVMFGISTYNKPHDHHSPPILISEAQLYDYRVQ